MNSELWLILLLELEVWQVGRQLEVWMLNDVHLPFSHSSITQDFEDGKKKND
jgi:hypothetical protein